jgi:ABC-type multidrug transport system ATPase subunit
MPASSRQFIGLQLLDRFDEVLLMKAGRLVAQGPVAQLAAHSRDFQELVGIAEFTQAAVSVAA